MQKFPGKGWGGQSISLRCPGEDFPEFLECKVSSEALRQHPPAPRWAGYK